MTGRIRLGADIGVPFTDIALDWGAPCRGAACGLSPFFRISTATSDEILTEAIARAWPPSSPPRYPA